MTTPTSANEGDTGELGDAAEHRSEDGAEDRDAERDAERLAPALARGVIEIHASAPAQVTVLERPWTNGRPRE